MLGTHGKFISKYYHTLLPYDNILCAIILLNGTDSHRLALLVKSEPEWSPCEYGV